MLSSNQLNREQELNKLIQLDATRFLIEIGVLDKKEMIQLIQNVNGDLNKAQARIEEIANLFNDNYIRQVIAKDKMNLNAKDIYCLYKHCFNDLSDFLERVLRNSFIVKYQLPLDSRMKVVHDEKVTLAERILKVFRTVAYLFLKDDQKFSFQQMVMKKLNILPLQKVSQIGSHSVAQNKFTLVGCQFGSVLKKKRYPSVDVNSREYRRGF